MFTSILCPIDFSEPYTRTRLLVLHVVSSIRGPARWRETLAAHERILLARARTKMDTFVAPLDSGLQLETLVTTESPADEIGAIAAEHNVGLIVMGLVGTSGLLGARPGSVAYRVLCLATVPVLALPSSTDASA